MVHTDSSLSLCRINLLFSTSERYSVFRVFVGKYEIQRSINVGLFLSVLGDLDKTKSRRTKCLTKS